jgi:hypothetical protein
MMKTSLPRFLAACLLSVCAGAHAEQGNVIWTNAQCGLHLVKTEGGYAFVQQLSAGPMAEGDIMDGPFEQDGRQHNILNVAKDAHVMVWVERFSNSKKVVMDRVPPRCRPKEG